MKLAVVDNSAHVCSGPGRLNLTQLRTTRYRVAQGALLLLLMCLALQVFSPLRLNTDAVVLLSMAESAADGDGFLYDGQRTHYSAGYPALLALLLKTGFGHPWVIVGSNVILLAVGLLATYHLLVQEFFSDKALILNLCSLSTLSFVVIKHVTIPVTEVAFFCCVMWCLALMARASAMAWGRRLGVAVAASCVLAFASITVRTIGIALIPALLFMIMSRPEVRAFFTCGTGRVKVIASVFGIGLGAGAVWVVITISTFRELVRYVKVPKIARAAFQIVSYRCTELGELLVNMPQSKLPAMARGAVPTVGILLLLLILGGLLTKQRHFGPTEVFFYCYTGVLFVWPFFDARFWLPVIPLLIAYSGLSLERVARMRTPKIVIVTYCIVFAALGVAAIGYSTRITFAGSRFPDVYGDGSLRPTYCVALQSCSGTFDETRVDSKNLHLLRTFK